MSEFEFGEEPESSRFPLDLFSLSLRDLLKLVVAICYKRVKVDMFL